MPDGLLKRLDRCARERGTSRSGLIRALAEQELAREDGRRADLIDDLLGKSGRYGGRGVAEVRQLRASR